MLQSDIQAWLDQTMQDWLGGPARVDQVIDGFYGQVYLLELAGGGRRVIKRFRIPGFAVQEAKATWLLRQRTPAHLAVPEILRFELAQQRQWDCFLMTFVPGVNATETPVEHADALAEQIVALQRHWHAQLGEAFEDLDGVRYPTFLDSYRAYLSKRCAFLQSAEGFSSGLKSRLLATLSGLEARLQPLAADPPVFIHDDGHAGNYLVDPVTWKLCAVIDPAGARFSHRELDLFHLPDARADYRLLERYLAQSPCAPGWPARRWLFSIWDDIKHAEFTGWRDEAWFERKLAEFEAADRVALSA
ncbi:phosphotransferase [Chitiniphilus purpureus]|uniref:Phosphotransferase n=1 Tax=Chitiniphilus purpureus TaxID=2981137 RepID=A0ABY6DNR4_9NEIS|nr:phosphotransferase [Chitiniphilus sp. CD1]UXY15662.1 phosphotransferase [Chitiniphilus sp. CD1]